MSTSKEMVFDLEPIEIPIKIGGKLYVLREASEGAAVGYRNLAMKAARMSAGKIVGIDGAADVEPYLVSQCLFETDGEGRIKTLGGSLHRMVNVPITTIREWPSRIVTPLFDKIKEISDLDRETEPETKEELLKQLEEIQDKLQKLEEADPTRGSSESTTDTSASPESRGNLSTS
jgi:hypothetical protein